MATRTDERLERFRAEYLPRLIQQFRPSLVLAFGSRVRGDALLHSDLDLIIVSAAFEQIRWLDRAARVIEALGISFGVDLLCYSPQEYQRKRQEHGIVKVATEEGVVLFNGSTADGT